MNEDIYEIKGLVLEVYDYSAVLYRQQGDDEIMEAYFDYNKEDKMWKARFPKTEMYPESRVKYDRFTECLEHCRETAKAYGVELTIESLALKPID